MTTLSAPEQRLQQASHATVPRMQPLGFHQNAPECERLLRCRCDRVLWSGSDAASVALEAYLSCQAVLVSDHKPVAALL
eukprot:5244500-Pleurochrysis_carterae.AAC.1